MSEAIFSRSSSLSTSPGFYGFGLTGLLKSRVEAKNMKDMAMANSVEGGGGRVITSSPSGGSSSGDFLKTPTSAGDPDKLDELLSREREEQRKREDMKAYPQTGPTAAEAMARAQAALADQKAAEADRNRRNEELKKREEESSNKQ